MRSLSTTTLALLLCCLWPLQALAASPVRYALVVGNNYGQTPPGVQLPELKHAQDEARRVRDQLVALGNFDPSPKRTVLLLGASREQVLAGARAIALQHKADRAALGEVPTLFAFFFTGHGLERQLLTSTDPLTGADLAALFSDVGATFTVGVFDACFSGSLDLKSLTAKGLALTPGFNAFGALPQELIDAQGTMWFASSRPDQVSYEDERLGGVFTHFFVEAMERAPATGVGITLEDVWEYARAHTQSYTSAAARPQTPQKLVRNLTSTGPLFFSFPARRSATLAFEEAVAGRFLLRYDTGQFSEVVTKAAGAALQVPVYPDELVLERLDGGGRQRVRLAAAETVWVRASTDWSGAAHSLGAKHVALSAKGTRLDGLVLTHEESGWSGLVDLGYRLAVGPRFGSTPTHGLKAGLRVDRGLWLARLSYGYGREFQSLPAWSYTLERHGGELGLGAAWTLGSFRLGPILSGRVGEAMVGYGDGQERSSTSWGGALDLCVLWRPPQRVLPLYVTAEAGVQVEWARPVAPIDAERAATLAPEVSIGLALELF